MRAKETNPNFMNGVPELLILRLLQQEEMYGYEIVQAIRDRTDAVIAVGEGVVYPVLHGWRKMGRCDPDAKQSMVEVESIIPLQPRVPVGWSIYRKPGTSWQRQFKPCCWEDTMPKPFRELRERLLRAGVAPRHVKRYLDELTDHLADLRNEELRAGRSASDAEAAALAQLGSIDDLANAMIEKRQFQSWCARAPWAMFGMAPALVLATAWGVALFILWSGWNIFLPGADTPFGGHRVYRVR